VEEGEVRWDDYPAEDLWIEDVDWTYRGNYIRTRSERRAGDYDVEPEWATQAVMDEHRLVAAPDPASKNGQTIRVVGYSGSADRVLVVILLPLDWPPITGHWVGVNAWAANSTHIRRYTRGE
jgi:hypothetical protein